MVKLGKAFSIFVVFTLLILLAPAVVLTGGSVALGNGEAVTEEVEASFSFTEATGGQWLGFTAGSGGIQGSPLRLALCQYTRQNVVIFGASANVSGCGFRNYTTGSGTVASSLGDLNGTMTLEWIAVRFNMQYSGTPKYATTTDFGWMWGRAHYYDEGNSADNFTFLFIADLDCNEGMTTATGKGFMESVEENGRFGNMSDPIEQRHKIMGDFDIALSGGTYTGNFHLRNYPPNEVYNVGPLNITGGVLQEATDPINPQVKLMNVSTDGPVDTPYDPGYQPGFEEIDWGKDPIKTVVNSTRLGRNGTMDLSRNTILYLNFTLVNATETWVRIQANPAVMLHINDTYGVTGDDDTAYGELWEILLLSLPQQFLKVVPLTPNFFNQTGFTFCPFGTVNGQPTSTTGLYEGSESFADAEIYIEATVGTAYQFSYDVSYGLYAHPKVESVFPSAGFANTTMDVKISGKYFLRANGTLPNSGSVDFGAGITVNSYTIMNNSPIDNAIIANITIGAAAPGPRDVNVTSCFGYSDPNGAAPYKSGVKVGGFAVTATGATLEGRVVAYPGYTQGLDVRFFEAGNPDFELAAQSSTTNATGDFVLSGLLPGSMDIGIKNSTSLSEMNLSVTLTDNATTAVVVFAKPLEGDCDDNDHVAYADYITLLINYDTYYDPANFDRIAKVGYGDYISLILNYDKKGDVRTYL